MFRRRKKRDDVEAVKRIPALAHHGSEVLETVAELGEVVDHGPGTVVVEQGAHSSQVFAVIEGSLEVTVDDDVVATIGDGEVFGESAVLDWWAPPRSDAATYESGRRTATVTTTSAVRALVFEPRDFEELRERAPAAARELLDAMSKRFREGTEDPSD